MKNEKKMQDTNWCNLSYPWPSLVHAGKHRTEAETSPNKHSLYAHNQCPTQASSGGKWYPLVFPCCWLQSLPTNNQNILTLSTHPSATKWSDRWIHIIWQQWTVLLDNCLATCKRKGQSWKNDGNKMSGFKPCHQKNVYLYIFLS